MRLRPNPKRGEERSGDFIDVLGYCVVVVVRCCIIIIIMMMSMMDLCGVLG